MQNKFLNSINNSIKLIILFLIILSIFLANSLFLILFLLTLEFIILMLINKSVNIYVDFIKKIKILLLFIFIIIYSDLLKAFIYTYKMTSCLILIKSMLMLIDFKSLNNGFYTILFPLKMFGLNILNISYNMTLAVYFLEFMINSSIEIKNIQLLKNKRTNNLKNFFLPRILFVSNKINQLESNLKLNFFEISIDRFNFKSIILLLLFIILFLTIVVKEVIL